MTHNKPTSMLHLSLLRLAKSDPRWRNLSSYEAHQVVWKAFSGQGQRPFLYHLQEHADHYGLLVQSQRPPDWSGLPGVEIGLKIVDPARVQAGDAFSFALRANPTAQREGYSDGKRRRVAVSANVELRKERAAARGLDVDEETFDRETTLLQWLARKGERGGFALIGSLEAGPERRCHAGPTVTYTIYRTAPEQRHGKRLERPITVHGCDYTGLLRVTDAEAFARTRTRGIGRARAFGFGLLMLTPFSRPF